MPEEIKKNKATSPSAPQEFRTIKEGMARTGYNLHYFRRKCKAGIFDHTMRGVHVVFTPEQFDKLPTSAAVKAKRAKRNKFGPLPSSPLFDGLNAD